MTEAVNSNGQQKSSLKSESTKYLTFLLGKESYGFETLKVIEIIGLVPITKVPRTEDYVRGVINLRGKIIPIIDLRLKFGMAGVEYDDKTCTVICNVGLGDRELAVGVVVDSVLEVVDFRQKEVKPAPDYGQSVDQRFIIGMGRSEHTNGRVDVLIDIDKVFDDADSITIIDTAS